MSKTLTEAQVTTANARSRLELGVHWRRLDAEAHLGYRKGKQSGVWFVRWRNHHKGGNYKQVPVGVANDINDKPAAGMLTFEQAVMLARLTDNPIIVIVMNGVLDMLSDFVQRIGDYDNSFVLPSRRTQGGR